jgi:hypothetical protein
MANTIPYKVDLSPWLKEGESYLSVWKDRYTIIEYPEKIVLNIFYRKYTIEFMFPFILNCFTKSIDGVPLVKWENIDNGMRQLISQYELTAGYTKSVLLELLQEKNRQVGNYSYESYLPLIDLAKAGDKDKLEEIEFMYLYSLLTQYSILLWAAYGGTGLTMLDAGSKISTIIPANVGENNILTYWQIEEWLGKGCALPFLISGK